MTTPEHHHSLSVMPDDASPVKPVDQGEHPPRDDKLSSPKPQLLEVPPAPSPKPSPRVQSSALPSDDGDDDFASMGFRPRGKVTHGTAGTKPVKK